MPQETRTEIIRRVYKPKSFLTQNGHYFWFWDLDPRIRTDVNIFYIEVCSRYLPSKIFFYIKPIRVRDVLSIPNYFAFLLFIYLFSYAWMPNAFLIRKLAKSYFDIVKKVTGLWSKFFLMIRSKDYFFKWISYNQAR